MYRIPVLKITAGLTEPVSPYYFTTASLQKRIFLSLPAALTYLQIEFNIDFIIKLKPFTLWN